MAKLNTKPNPSTRPIGDIFCINIDNKEVYLQVVPEIYKAWCSGCYLHNNYCYEVMEYRGYCYHKFRDDHQGVIFKEIHPESEPNLGGDCSK